MQCLRLASVDTKCGEYCPKRRREMREHLSLSRARPQTSDRGLVEYARAGGDERAPLGTARAILYMTRKGCVGKGVELSDSVRRVVSRTDEGERRMAQVPQVRADMSLELDFGSGFAQVNGGLEPGGVRESTRRKARIGELKQTPAR
jgi:hypothetical protein